MSAEPNPRYSWTQPSCAACFALLNPGRNPVRMKLAEKETCVYCGKDTMAGIYVRVNPLDAAHPTLLKEDL